MFTVDVDIGGTFTDVFVLDKETKRTFIYKPATTPDYRTYKHLRELL